MNITIYQADDGWRWRIKAANNETLASGEAYTRRQDCEDVIRLLFNTPGAIDVHVRDRGGEAVKQYTLRGPAPLDDADTHTETLELEESEQ